MPTKVPTDILELLQNAISSVTDVKYIDRSIRNAVRDPSQVCQAEQDAIWLSGNAVHDLEAFAYPDDSQPGKHKVVAFNRSGDRFEESGGFVPVQASATSIPNHSRPVSDIAQDVDVNVACRVDALNEWGILDNDAAASYVLSQLEQENTATEWLAALVYSAEVLKFKEQDQRTTLSKCLLSVASEYRVKNEPGADAIAFSALRRCASILPIAEVDLLMPFLHPSGCVDTRLVTLQGICHIFEVEPSDNGHPQLGERIFGMVSKFLDIDILVPGEVSAIAESAIIALSVLGDLRLNDCAHRVRELSIPWFSEVVHGSLSRLVQDDWAEEFREGPVYQRALDARNEIAQHVGGSSVENAAI